MRLHLVLLLAACLPAVQAAVTATAVAVSCQEDSVGCPAAPVITSLSTPATVNFATGGCQNTATTLGSPTAAQCWYSMTPNFPAGIFTSYPRLVLGGGAPGCAAGTPCTATMTYTTVPNAVLPLTTMTVNIRDSTGVETGTVTFTFEITNVNDPPVFTSAIPAAGFQVTAAERASGNPISKANALTGVHQGVGETGQNICGGGPCACTVMNGAALFATPPTLVLSSYTAVQAAPATGSINFQVQQALAGCPCTADISCTLNDDGAPPASSVVNFKITVEPDNTRPLATCTAAGLSGTSSSPCRLQVNEDNDPTARSPVGGSKVDSSNQNAVQNVFRLHVSSAADASTQAFEASQQNLLLPANCVVIGGSCAAAPKQCFEVLPTITNVNGDMEFTLAQDAAGIANIRCEVFDVFTATSTQGLSSFVEAEIIIAEVNDPPVASLGTALVNGITVQEDCGRSGIGQSCSINNSLTSIRDAIMGEQTINNVLVRALAGKQGPATAVSEQSQAAQILCATSSQLFDGGSCDGMLNTAQGPGCPRIDPVSNVLTFRPAIHAVGDADVTCTIYDFPTGTGVQAQSLQLPTFRIRITEVNDPPYAEVDNTTVPVPTGQTLPRLIMQEDHPSCDQHDANPVACEVAGFLVTNGRYPAPFPGGLLPGPPSESGQGWQITCNADCQQPVTKTGTETLQNCRGANLFRKATSNLPAGIPWFDGTARSNLRFVPQPDRSGTAKIHCTMTDSGSGVTTANQQKFAFEFVVELTEQNDPPIANPDGRYCIPIANDPSKRCSVDWRQSNDRYSQDGFFIPPLTQGGNGLAPGPPDEVATQTLTVNCVTQSDLFSEKPSVNINTGGLTFIPTGTKSGTAEVTCTFRDNGSPVMETVRKFLVRVVPTVRQYLKETDSTSTMHRLVQKAQMEAELDTTTMTVFTPVNGAFQKLPKGIMEYLEDDMPSLRKFLKCHIVRGAKYEAEAAFQASNTQPLLTWYAEETSGAERIRVTHPVGSDYMVSEDPETATTPTARVLTPNNRAWNGMVHLLDNALDCGLGIVNRIPEAVDLDPTLSITKKAIDDTGLRSPGSAIGQLEQAGPMTFFAPTDAAWQKLPANTRNTILNDRNTLKRILLAHTLPKYLTCEDITASNTLPITEGTLLSDQSTVVPLQIDSSAGQVTISGQVNEKSNVVKCNTLATNGIVHNVDSLVQSAALLLNECFQSKCGIDQRCEDPNWLINSRGDFRCICVNGGGEAVGGSVSTCVLNECANNPCGAGQICNDRNTLANSINDFECRCAASTIVRVGRPALCNGATSCAANPCGTGQTCTDEQSDGSLLGTFRCCCGNTCTRGEPAPCGNAVCLNNPCCRNPDGTVKTTCDQDCTPLPDSNTYKCTCRQNTGNFKIGSAVSLCSPTSLCVEGKPFSLGTLKFSGRADFHPDDQGQWKYDPINSIKLILEKKPLGGVASTVGAGEWVITSPWGPAVAHGWYRRTGCSSPPFSVPWECVPPMKSAYLIHPAPCASLQGGLPGGEIVAPDVLPSTPSPNVITPGGPTTQCNYGQQTACEQDARCQWSTLRLACEINFCGLYGTQQVSCISDRQCTWTGLRCERSTTSVTPPTPPATPPPFGGAGTVATSLFSVVALTVLFVL